MIGLKRPNFFLFNILFFTRLDNFAARSGKLVKRDGGSKSFDPGKPIVQPGSNLRSTWVKRKFEPG